jgi:CubicO group peptidase (beta-lactamase class C family)
MRYLRWCTIALATMRAMVLADTAIDFDSVTELANGAIAGTNVATPVPGFELLLMKDGQVVYDQAFGYWQVGQVANIDSASKTLAGAVMMSLTDSSPNPFSLDTKLSSYMPEFSGAYKQDITIRNAFSHTSGYFASTALDNPSLSLHDSAVQIASEPTYFPPGYGFAYGGAGMQAAGAVAEIAAGQPWDQLVYNRITSKLGMTNTQYVAQPGKVPTWVGGGAQSTAQDFARFMEMLREGGSLGGVRVLSSAAVQQMFTRQTSDDVNVYFSPLNHSADYGVGVWLDQRDSQGNLTGALAAGARGFTSWIDFPNHMVGVLSTYYTPFANIQDLQYLIRAAAGIASNDPQLAGDCNLDGKVDLSDLMTMASNANRHGMLWSQGDFNGDGIVTTQDAWMALRSYFAGLYGASPDRAAAALARSIPEPSSLGLAVVGGALVGAALLRRGRASAGR